ncbi:hypothetical protein RPC_1702 [Rhodopseudomonas palustris BisB18]|uniref:Uncharacterized protein n=1 Tax=Rhodopseudomonas palustris (strain BisB18) TaxID=316056 RepID=Q218C5_RHOPB
MPGRLQVAVSAASTNCDRRDSLSTQISSESLFETFRVGLLRFKSPPAVIPGREQLELRASQESITPAGDMDSGLARSSNSQSGMTAAFGLDASIPTECSSAEHR